MGSVITRHVEAFVVARARQRMPILRFAPSRWIVIAAQPSVQRLRRDVRTLLVVATGSVAIFLTALALSASGAQAASRPAAGWYGGKTGASAIAFRVTASGRLRDLRLERVGASCADATSRSIGLRPGATGSRSTSVRSGRISWRTATGDDNVGGLTGRVTLAGSFTSRRRASGTLRISFTWPDGVSCRVAVRPFTVRRRASAPAIAVVPYRIFVGTTAAGQPLELALAEAGDALRVARMRAPMSCVDGTSVTLDVVNPIGPDIAITPEATYAGSWRYTPPAISGRPAPSGGGVQISGRVTPTGLDGAVRLSMGFMDGIACDGGWTRFTLAGNTAAG